MKVRIIKKDPAIVVGALEVAFMIQNISTAIPNSVSVNLGEKNQDDASYDFSLPNVPKKFEPLLRAIYGPWLFGRLVCNYRNFLYVGRLGFLNSNHDQRNWEFRFLKSKGSKITSYLVGSDVRSPILMGKLQAETQEENIGTYQFASYEMKQLDAYENKLKEFTQGINKYSHHIFTAKFDQASYLRSDAKPFMYFCPDKVFEEDFTKFENIDRLRIVHAPTNTTIKGTNLVRAAIRKLQLEGYDFDYIEIQRMKNQELLSILAKSHILLNEFYGFMPGVLAIEGMAKCCVVLTRADYKYENDLGPESSKAWITTPPYAIYDNLKSCLDGKVSLQKQSKLGFDWAYKNALASNSGKRLIKLLKPI